MGKSFPAQTKLKETTSNADENKNGTRQAKKLSLAFQI
jgi:hypothetical protein